MSTTMSGGEIMPFCATENLQNLPLVEWCDQYWMKFPSLVFEIWCSQGFRDAQTHLLTDEQNRIHNASSTMTPMSGWEPAHCGWTRPRRRSCGSAPASSWSTLTSTTSRCRLPSKSLRARATISNSRHIRDVSRQVETITRNSKIRNGSFIGIHRVRAI